MIHFYHPNKSVTGFAASFWRSERDDTVFATILKQSGWDDKIQNGTFKDSVNDPLKKVNIKLDYVEICGILDCIERNRPFSVFHDNEESPKAIAFSPWMEKNSNPPKQRGFSFTITVTSKQDSTFKNSFYIGLTYAEARLIREFLIFVLHVHFNKRINSAPQTTQQAPKNEINPPEQPSTPSEPSNEAAAPLDPLLDF